MILYCTQRAAREFSFGRSQLEYADIKTTDPMDCWYAHIFFIGRMKCLMVTHGGSLFSAVKEGFKRTDCADLEELIQGMVSETLFLEDFSSEVIQKGAALIRDVKYAKASDKRVLGSMNDMIKIYKYERAPGYDTYREKKEALHGINCMPMKYLKYKHAAEAFMHGLGYTDYKTHRVAL